jgi:hypothetical protein
VPWKFEPVRWSGRRRGGSTYLLYGEGRERNERGRVCKKKEDEEALPFVLPPPEKPSDCQISYDVVGGVNFLVIMPYGLVDK